MHNEFTAVFERDGDWVIAYSPEIPGANGQGRTKDEARESLAQGDCVNSRQPPRRTLTLQPRRRAVMFRVRPEG